MVEYAYVWQCFVVTSCWSHMDGYKDTRETGDTEGKERYCCNQIQINGHDKVPKSLQQCTNHVGPAIIRVATPHTPSEL